MTARAPTLPEIRAAHASLGSRIRRTPTWAAPSELLEGSPAAGISAWMKLELFQITGSFKPRGALLHADGLDPQTRAAGLTAVSAGNHAMAVAYAALCHRTSAKVVMPRSASVARVEACKRLGAQVVLVSDVHTAFEEVRRIEQSEGRSFVHPFDGETVALGTGTLALELHEDLPDLDAVVVPIGGGGLAAGIAAAMKQLRPECQVFGVEPLGADTMYRSFQAGSIQGIDAVRSIADSLGAPHAAEYSFELCRRFVDDVVRVSDDELKMSMAAMFSRAKLAVEPAGAAAVAALRGPLAQTCRDRRVGLIVCGANIDIETFGRHVTEGAHLLEQTAGS